MARNREENSVLATIERLTGKSPCPEYLRNALNKYLKIDEIFPAIKKENRGSAKGKLAMPDTDALVLNGSRSLPLKPD